MRGPVAMWKQLILSVLLIGGAAALWLGQDRARQLLGHAAEPAAERAAERETGVRETGVPVIVAPVAAARDDLVLEVVGTGRARKSVMLRAETSGKIVELALAPGRRFAEGETLLRLDDRAQRLALSLAETRLAEAERVLARYERLEGTGAATSATLDERATAAEVARIEVEQAREALADRAVRAPFDGVSGLPEIETGDWIESGDAIASFDDRSAILAEFELPEALLARVGPDLAVTATTPAVPDRRFDGRVSAIDSRLDATTRTARIRVEIPNPDDLLRPGASFAVRLELPGETYPLVPEMAVQFSRGTLHVWRVRDGRAEKVEVSLVRRRAGEVLVDGPLAEGEPVVVEGTQRLRPDEPVEVIGGGGTS